MVKNEFQIELSFALLDRDINFSIKIYKQLFCRLCNIKEEKDEIFPCLININKYGLNIKSLSEDK